MANNESTTTGVSQTFQFYSTPGTTSFADYVGYNRTYSDEDNNMTMLDFSDNTTTVPHITAEDDMIPVGTTILALLWGIPLLMCGILGNGPLIMCIVLVRQLRTTTNYIVLSRAVMDLVMTFCVNAPLLMTYAYRTWRFGEAACLFMLFMVSAGMTICLCHTVTIAFTRYLFISNPLSYKKLGRPRALIAIFLLLYGMPVVLLSPILKEGLQAPPGGLHFDLRSMHCMLTARDTGLLKSFIMLAVAFVLMAYIFIRSYLVVSKSLRIEAVNTSNPIPITGSRSSLMKRELTFIGSVCVIFLVFLVTYVPWPLVYEISNDTNPFPWNVFMAVVILAWVSSSTNWIILVSMNKSFRKAFLSLPRYLFSRGLVAPEINGPPPRLNPGYPNNRKPAHQTPIFHLKLAAFKWLPTIRIPRSTRT